MLCNKCGKNEANVYFKSTVNGKTTEYSVCSECAKELGLLKSFEDQAGFIQNNFFGGSFMDNMFGHSMLGSMARNMRQFDSMFDRAFRIFAPPAFDSFALEQEKADACPYCGHTLEEYKKTGKFGCAMCYEVFKDQLDFAGKAAGTKGKEKEESAEGKTAEDTRQRGTAQQIADLRSKLEHAVKEEKYEIAAQIRDEIKKLEHNG